MTNPPASGAEERLHGCAHRRYLLGGQACDEDLPGGIAFPLDDIDGQAARLLPDKAAAVAVYCSNAVCNNSHAVSERLTQLGYTSVFRYTEGKQDWIEAGLPVESASAVA